IVLFATSGGSGFGKAVDGLKGSVDASAAIKEGKILNGKISEEELKIWADKF
nr:flavodoxin [Clostridiales bacterium]